MEKRQYIKIYKSLLESISATDEQIHFIEEQFADESSVVGIHNTYFEHKNFFDVGLRNYNSDYKNTNDLTNTVMYNTNLAVLLCYPNGDGIKREKTAIILKIPKEVFEHKQGIFQNLKDKTYGIPPEYIVGAFEDGKVIKNPSYNRDYNNKEAAVCKDSVESIKELQERQEQLKYFNSYYYKTNPIKSFFNSVRDSFLGRKKAPLALSAENKTINQNTKKDFLDAIVVKTDSANKEKESQIVDSNKEYESKSDGFDIDR